MDWSIGLCPFLRGHLSTWLPSWVEWLAASPDGTQGRLAFLRGSAQVHYMQRFCKFGGLCLELIHLVRRIALNNNFKVRGINLAS
eukprot:5676001-Amphidinium_carterae.1